MRLSPVCFFQALWNIHTAKKLGGFTLIEIPIDTKEILRRIIDIGIGHTPIDFSDLPITDIWDNAKDLGKKDTTFYHIENEFFIVYFYKGKDVIAETTLAIATRAIPKLQSVFNRFPDPKRNTDANCLSTSPTPKRNMNDWAR